MGQLPMQPKVRKGEPNVVQLPPSSGCTFLIGSVRQPPTYWHRFDALSRAVPAAVGKIR